MTKSKKHMIMFSRRKKLFRIWMMLLKPMMTLRTQKWNTAMIATQDGTKKVKEVLTRYRKMHKNRNQTSRREYVAKIIFEFIKWVTCRIINYQRESIKPRTFWVLKTKMKLYRFWDILTGTRKKCSRSIFYRINKIKSKLKLGWSMIKTWSKSIQK